MARVPHILRKRKKSKETQDKPGITTVLFHRSDNPETEIIEKS